MVKKINATVYAQRKLTFVSTFQRKNVIALVFNGGGTHARVPETKN